MGVETRKAGCPRRLWESEKFRREDAKDLARSYARGTSLISKKEGGRLKGYIYILSQNRCKTLRSCLGMRAPLPGKDVRGAGGGEAHTGFRREVWGTEWGQLGLDRPAPALGELWSPQLLTLIYRLSSGPAADPA